MGQGVGGTQRYKAKLPTLLSLLVHITLGDTCERQAFCRSKDDCQVHREQGLFSNLGDIPTMTYISLCILTAARPCQNVPLVKARLLKVGWGQ